MKNVKTGPAAFDAQEFIRKNVEKALSGSHVVTLRENGAVTPQMLAVEARRNGLVAEIQHMTVKMAVKKETVETVE